jgi:hypothetical protein
MFRHLVENVHLGIFFLKCDLQFEFENYTNKDVLIKLVPNVSNLQLHMLSNIFLFTCQNSSVLWAYKLGFNWDQNSTFHFTYRHLQMMV